MNPFLIYLWGIADSASSLFAGVALAVVIITIVSLIIGAIVLIESDFEGQLLPIATKIGTWGIGIAATSAVLSVLIPDSKTIAAMVIIPAIVESEVIREDLPELYDAAMSKLKSELGIAPEIEK